MENQYKEDILIKKHIKNEGLMSPSDTFLKSTMSFIKPVNKEVFVYKPLIGKGVWIGLVGILVMAIGFLPSVSIDLGMLNSIFDYKPLNVSLNLNLSPQLIYSFLAFGILIFVEAILMTKKV